MFVIEMIKLASEILSPFRSQETNQVKTNKQKNKQTNKQTNQPTSQQTNKVNMVNNPYLHCHAPHISTMACCSITGMRYNMGTILSNVNLLYGYSKYATSNLDQLSMNTLSDLNSTVVD